MTAMNNKLLFSAFEAVIKTEKTRGEMAEALRVVLADKEDDTDESVIKVLKQAFGIVMVFSCDRIRSTLVELDAAKNADATLRAELVTTDASADAPTDAEAGVVNPLDSTD